MIWTLLISMLGVVILFVSFSSLIIRIGIELIKLIINIWCWFVSMVLQIGSVIGMKTFESTCEIIEATHDKKIKKLYEQERIKKEQENNINYIYTQNQKAAQNMNNFEFLKKRYKLALLIDSSFKL